MKNKKMLKEQWKQRGPIILLHNSIRCCLKVSRRQKEVIKVNISAGSSTNINWIRISRTQVWQPLGTRRRNNQRRRSERNIWRKCFWRRRWYHKDRKCSLNVKIRWVPRYDQNYNRRRSWWSSNLKQIRKIGYIYR